MTKPFLYSFDGVFFESTKGNPSYKWRGPLPAGAYHDMLVEFAVEVSRPYRNALMLYLGRAMPGRNPTAHLLCHGMWRRREVLFRYGRRRAKGWVARPKAIAPQRLPMREGVAQVRYRRQRTGDGPRSTLEIVQDGRRAVATATGPDVLPVTFDGRQELEIDIGYDGKVPIHPAPIGWSFRNLRAELR